MQFYADVSLAVAVACFLCLLIGLYRPWLMLWWEDTQNRKKIFKVYGSATLLFSTGYYILHHFAL